MKLSRFAVAGFAMMLARNARADDRPFVIGSTPAWVLLGGVTGGASFALDSKADKGGLVGAEVSFARLRESTFFGVYADGYYDWGVDGTYVTGGVEFGHKYLGVDGGVALRFAGDGIDAGATGRVTVGIGVVGVYARYAHFWTTTDDDNVIQVGLMVKLPLWTEGK